MSTRIIPGITTTSTRPITRPITRLITPMAMVMAMAVMDMGATEADGTAGEGDTTAAAGTAEAEEEAVGTTVADAKCNKLARLFLYNVTKPIRACKSLPRHCWH